MILPGKLALGYLQEDNPQKFYFRVCPLLIRDENGCQVIENPKEEFQDDGFIRIVPDKNEINHFKNRMRALGRYCLIDLRRHGGENDKIRPNKNHSGENGDRNAYIVYSDVIGAMPAHFMAEGVEPDQDGLFPIPGTPLVAAMLDGEVKGIYTWQDQGDAACIEGDNLAKGDLSGAAEKLITADLGGREVRMLLNLDDYGIEREEEPAPARVPAPAAQPVSAAQPAPAAQPVSAPAERRAEPPREARPEPEPAKPEPKAHEPEEERQPEEKTEKPWLQRTTYVFPRVVNPRVTSRSQAMRLQTGFNPPRSTGIKDIVDDMWRQSRLDQLGHPVPPEASGTPVISPVDKALEAVREAWRLPEARASVLSGLLRLEDMDAMLGANGSGDPAAAREEREREQQMSRFEADRLKVLCEIDELKKLRDDKRQELIDELKRARAGEMAQLDKKNKALEETARQLRQEADEARAAAEASSKAFQDVTKGLDDRMTKQLMLGRARDMILAMNRAPRSERVLPETEEMTAGELISALRVRMEEAGAALDNDEAVNLLACLTLGRCVALSGPAGSGKSHTARALSSALGIRRGEYARYAETRPAKEGVSFGMTIEESAASGVPLLRQGEMLQALQTDDEAALAVALIDDANRVCPEMYLSELLAQMDSDAPGRLRTGGEDIRLGDPLRVIVTLQDAGCGQCVPAGILDRMWLIRLRTEACDTPWRRKKSVMPDPEKAVSLATLRSVFDPRRDVPGEIVERMGAIRRRLGEVGVLISRRALDDMYDYCAAVSPLMTASPIEVLDWAFAQRAMPAILASAGLTALHALPEILPDMPRSLRLMAEPLPLPPI